MESGEVEEETWAECAFLPHFEIDVGAIPSSFPPLSPSPYLGNDWAIINFSMCPPCQRVIPCVLPKEGLNPIFRVGEMPVI